MSPAGSPCVAGSGPMVRWPHPALRVILAKRVVLWPPHPGPPRFPSPPRFPGRQVTSCTNAGTQGPAALRAVRSVVLWDMRLLKPGTGSDCGNKRAPRPAVGGLGAAELAGPLLFPGQRDSLRTPQLLLEWQPHPYPGSLRQPARWTSPDYRTHLRGAGETALLKPSLSWHS